MFSFSSDAADFLRINLAIFHIVVTGCPLPDLTTVSLVISPCLMPWRPFPTLVSLTVIVGPTPVPRSPFPEIARKGAECKSAQANGKNQFFHVFLVCLAEPFRLTTALRGRAESANS